MPLLLFDKVAVDLQSRSLSPRSFGMWRDANRYPQFCRSCILIFNHAAFPGTSIDASVSKSDGASDIEPASCLGTTLECEVAPALPLKRP